VIEYVVVMVGQTGFVNPMNVYVCAPEGVSVAQLPGHIAVGFETILMVGFG
jgi:hypothetical protein